MDPTYYDDELVDSLLDTIVLFPLVLIKITLSYYGPSEEIRHSIGKESALLHCDNVEEAKGVRDYQCYRVLYRQHLLDVLCTKCPSDITKNVLKYIDLGPIWKIKLPWYPRKETLILDIPSLYCQRLTFKFLMCGLTRPGHYRDQEESDYIENRLIGLACIHSKYLNIIVKHNKLKQIIGWCANKYKCLEDIKTVDQFIQTVRDYIVPRYCYINCIDEIVSNHWLQSVMKRDKRRYDTIKKGHKRRYTDFSRLLKRDIGLMCHNLNV
jgi:hypothetical protein